MKRLLTGRYLWKRQQQLLMPALAVMGLVFLFVKAQPLDSDLHYSMISDLRELQARDAELGEAVLQHHYQLFHNYDAVVAIMKRMQELGSAVQYYHDQGLLPNSPQANNEMNAMKKQIEIKSISLEKFKSDNAVSKTAMIYLPLTVKTILDQLPMSDLSYHEEFELLLRDALLMEVNQSTLAKENLKSDIAMIEHAIPEFPQSLRDPAIRAMHHAKSILETEYDMPDLLETLSSHGKKRIGSEIERLYMENYRRKQLIATNYRLLLFLAVISMLGYAINTFYRARERAQQLRIAAAAFETHESIMIFDPQRRIQRVNGAFTRLTGYRPEEVIGKTPDILKSDKNDEDFFRKRWEILRHEGYWQGEVWNRHKNGKVYQVWLTTTAVKDAGGIVTHYVSIVTDITERKEAEEKIHQLAFYDPLTNLPNRRLLIDRLDHAMASSVRSGEHSALLFIDLDNFKVLNDTKGHEVGDLLLVEVARRLLTCVRGGDTVARLGGDEFVVMLGDLSQDVEQAATQAKVAGENIREFLSRFYLLNNFEHHGTCSIGISLFHADEVSVEDLLRRADTAMYEAKTSGRNALRFFDPNMQAALEARVLLESDLRTAIIEKQFKLFYQVQVNETGQPVGAEALLRWVHPSRGSVAPDEFIPLAEENGLILHIGQWVLETACAQIRAWELNPLACELQIAVNVSARQFHQPHFVELVMEALRESDANPSRLKIELTESAVLDDISDTAAKMHQLKKAGVRFSMDDFGTGYSSLAYLTQLPLNQLKIDQSFVRNIGTKSSDAVIVQTIIGMANNLGMEVIAEGVETDAQHSFLKRAGCLSYQGYLFGRPVPLEEFEGKVLRRFSKPEN